MAADRAPVAVAAAIIERQGRYLIAQRLSDAALGGLWEFPGGKCRAGETLERCLEREILEELGVRVTIGRLERRVSHSYDHAHVDLHFYRCELAEGEPAPLGCQAVRWVLPSELSGFTFPAANQPLIDALSRG
jgi:mutator protein MutT